MGRVRILATGGTIAGKAPSEVDEGYSSGELAVDALLRTLPELGTLAEVKGEQLAQIGSQDMNDALWLKLAANDPGSCSPPARGPAHAAVATTFLRLNKPFERKGTQGSKTVSGR